MGIEIERRFLVAGSPWESLLYKKETFLQGYLTSGKEDWTIRVRIINNKKSFLTLKSPSISFSSNEFEYSIPINDGISLMNLSKYKLSKTRYSININSSLWVIDKFHEKNDSLVIAEIEMLSLDEKIIIPSWCIEEITGLNALSNLSLAKRSILEWPLDKRK